LVAVAEPLEGRTLLAAQVLPDVVQGSVANAYVLSGGVAEQTPLAGWTVYEDANNNGAFDRGLEPWSQTDLDGTFTLDLFPNAAPGAAATVRVVPRTGWATPAAQVVSSSAAAVAPLAFQTAMLSPVVIDLLIAYTADAAAESFEPIADRAREMVRYANRVLANSDANARVNLLDLKATAYRESGRISTDLTRLQRPSDGHLDDVTSRRESVGADLAVLLTSFAATGGSTVGLAYQYDRSAPNNAQYAMSVVAVRGTNADGMTLAHEIGHNLGAGHDRESSDGEVTAPYARGYRFYGDDGIEYRDAMAYDPGVELPVFSDPSFVYAGHRAGDARTADNARIVTETAPVAAKYRRRRTDTGPTDPAAAGGRPDLVAASVKATRAADWRAGRTMTAGVRVLNQGDAPAKRKVTIELYLSADATLDGGDRRVAKASKSLALNEARAKTVSVRVKLPKALDDGAYRLLARVDATDRVREADETNNVGAGPLVTVTGGAPADGSAFATSRAIAATAGVPAAALTGARRLADDIFRDDELA